MSTDASRGRAAATRFHRVAAEILREKDAAATYADVARIVTARPQHYHAAVTGRRAVSVELVSRWMSAWEEAGWPALRLVLTAADTLVELSPEEPSC